MSRDLLSWALLEWREGWAFWHPFVSYDAAALWVCGEGRALLPYGSEPYEGALRIRYMA